MSSNIGQEGVEECPADGEDGGAKRLRGGAEVDASRFSGWPSSSRIVRVSRATGGKDRHSKVWTSKGLRDRRVRLSVNTAIQLFDLQDRLDYDQPSKAIEWLLKAAAASIDELPPIDTQFRDIPKQFGDGFDSAGLDLDGDPNFQQKKQRQRGSLSRSTCSSTSETSKGSGLSLSRTESRTKAAREQVIKKETKKGTEKENMPRIPHHHNINAIDQNSSFTQLLTAGIVCVSNTTTTKNGSDRQKLTPCVSSQDANLLHKSSLPWNSTPMDYFTSGLGGPSSSRASSSIFLVNSLPSVPQFNVAGEDQPELQQYQFPSEHLIPVVTAAGSGAGSNNNTNNHSAEYSLNFTISSTSGHASLNRGTLQSNSPSPLPHLQRFSPVDGSSNFFWTTASDAADQKGKGKY